MKIMFDKDEFEQNILCMLNEDPYYGEYFIDEVGNICYRSHDGKINEIETKGELVT